MKKIIKEKNKGLAFWIIGLPGSGKTTFAFEIKKEINNLFGKTLVISGDNLRNIFNLKKFSKDERISLGKKYTNFCNFLINQNINVIFAAGGMFEEIRKYNKKVLKKNYIEIYIKSSINQIISLGKKKIYIKEKKNIFGIDIFPQIPKKSHIVVKNDFKKTKKQIKKIILNKIIKLVSL